MAKRYGTASGIELYLSFTKYGKKVFKDMNRKCFEDDEKQARHFANLVNGELVKE